MVCILSTAAAAGIDVTFPSRPGNSSSGNGTSHWTLYSGGLGQDQTLWPTSPVNVLVGGSLFQQYTNYAFEVRPTGQDPLGYTKLGSRTGIGGNPSSDMLTVYGTSTFTGEATFTSGIDVMGNTLGDDVIISGDITMGDEITLNEGGKSSRIEIFTSGDPRLYVRPDIDFPNILFFRLNDVMGNGTKDFLMAHAPQVSASNFLFSQNNYGNLAFRTLSQPGTGEDKGDIIFSPLNTVGLTLSGADDYANITLPLYIDDPIQNYATMSLRTGELGSVASSASNYVKYLPMQFGQVCGSSSCIQMQEDGGVIQFCAYVGGTLTGTNNMDLLVNGVQVQTISMTSGSSGCVSVDPANADTFSAGQYIACRFRRTGAGTSSGYGNCKVDYYYQY